MKKYITIPETFKYIITSDDVVHTLLSGHKDESFKIKEFGLNMYSLDLIDGTLKQGNNSTTMDWFLRLHTIWNKLEEKNIIYSIHPNCTWNFYDWTFKCIQYTYVPISIKFIFCEDWQKIYNLFDSCSE